MLNRPEVPRVIHVSTSHRADDGRIFDRECRSLANTGLYHVYLAAAGSMPGNTSVQQIPLKETPPSRIRRFALGPTRSLGLAVSSAADLWHFHDPELLPVALLLAQQGQRVVWDAHEDYIQQISTGSDKEWIPRSLRPAVRTGALRLFTAIDRKASAVVAATETIADKYTNPNTVIVGNEARLEEFKQCQPTPCNRQVLFTGSVHARNLFEDVALAVGDFDELTLAVAGKTPDPTLWHSAERALGQRLTYLGWLDREGLANEISRSIVGIASYAPLETYQASQLSPNKLFEFAAGGLPVVGTPVKYLKEEVDRHGFGSVATDFSREGLASAISRVIRDSDVWSEMSRNARDWSRREGDWKRSEESLIRLYASLFSRESGQIPSSCANSDAEFSKGK